MAVNGVDELVEQLCNLNVAENRADEITDQLCDLVISEWRAEEDENNVDNDDPKIDGTPIRKLFVGNLSVKSSYIELRKIFKHYGPLADVCIARDKYTHAKKKYGFVTFKNPQDAKKVLRLKPGELQLHFKTLYMKPADAQHQPIELADGQVLWKRKPPNKNDSVRKETKKLKRRGRAPRSERKVAIADSSVEPENEVTTTGISNNLIGADECKIDILNDDCLNHIFLLLPKRDRIRIERVCRRWRTVCLNMWKLEKHLDFASPSFSAGLDQLLDMNILESFLKRCGDNLKSLDLSHKPNDLTARVPKLLHHYCKNLRCLNLGGVPLSPRGIGFLCNISGELRHLNLDGCPGVLDKLIQKLFTFCPNLETVSLSHQGGISGKCLHGLKHSPLKKLVLDECNNLINKWLVTELQNLKQLVYLSINSCINISSSDVTNIVNALPRLQSLSISKYFPLFGPATLNALGSLRELTTLNVQLNPAVNDEFLENLAQNCRKLENLNISGCTSNPVATKTVTDVGLKCLAKLSNLSHLSMSYLGNVSDEALNAVACNSKLRKLICRGCPKFTDIGCISVVTSCSELELFDLSGCDFITVASVKAASDSVKLRTNNIKLTMIVGGTSVSPSADIEKNALLDVNFSNLCVAHLRPDFMDNVYFHELEDEYYDSYDEDEEDDVALDDMIDDWEWECQHEGDMEFLDECYEDAEENCLGID